MSDQHGSVDWVDPDQVSASVFSEVTALDRQELIHVVLTMMHLRAREVPT